MRPLVRIPLDRVGIDGPLDTAVRDGNDMNQGDAPHAPA